MAGKPRFGSGPKPIQKANTHTHISSLAYILLRYEFTMVAGNNYTQQKKQIVVIGIEATWLLLLLDYLIKRIHYLKSVYWQ